MKYFLLIGASIAMSFVSLSQSPSVDTLDRFLSTYFAKGSFNGTALISWHGKVILEKGYGYRNFTDSSRNDPSTIYQIASVTKQFTSTLILRLVEENKLSLSDRLSKFKPEIPRADSVTIRHLLSHTSGISDHPTDSVTRALNFSPGTSWEYSNTGYILLGRIIEQVTGMSYYNALRRYIFEPLQMSHTAFDFINLKSKDKATGYWEYPDEPNPSSATIIDSTGPFAAGAIYSTVGDLFKWHQGLQSHRVLSEQSARQAYNPVLNNYGFGWFIDSIAGRRIVSHSGDIWGFRSNLARIPQDDVCIVLLGNTEDQDLRNITFGLLSILYRQPYTLPSLHQQISVPASSLGKFVGTYEVSIKNFVLVITLEDGKLMSQVPGQPKFRLRPEKEDLYFVREFDATVEFGATNGIVDKCWILQGGNRIEGKKVK